VNTRVFQPFLQNDRPSSSVHAGLQQIRELLCEKMSNWLAEFSGFALGSNLG